MKILFISKKQTNNNLYNRGWLFVFFILFCSFNQKVLAHQTPSTIVLMDVNPRTVSIELQLPLGELELAFGHQISKDPEHLIENFGAQLKEYLLAHIHPMSAKDKPWMVEVTNMTLGKSEQTASGPYQEITVYLSLIPPVGTSTRKFIFDYDVIIHQLVTHSALVSIRSDWEQGNTNKVPHEVGVIRVDTKTTLIYPLEINLKKGGSWWTGFKGMISLGMEHIKAGTDHLLFLLVLLLPATLTTNGKKWGLFGGVKFSILKLLKVVTAFTFGHSITLLISALGWFQLPTQPVEVLIAVSILVSAIHAIRPIFAGKEMYVAAGFGLIHGLAFASVLSNLNLDTSTMVWSILGFNMGIEIMQLLVLICIIPWIILLSQTSIYKSIRVVWAILAGLAAMAWIAERITKKPNYISTLIQNNDQYAPWAVLLLAIVALFFFTKQNRKNNNKVLIM